MPFAYGQGENPAGQPIGNRRKVAELVEAMLEDAAEEITRRTIERAMAGDTTAMRLCLERLLPRSRGRPAPFALSKIEGPDDMPGAACEIWSAVGAGMLTPREATELLRAVVSGPGHQTKNNEIQ
jgi:hypothetical protein